MKTVFCRKLCPPPHPPANNPPIGSGDKSADKAHFFTVFIVWWSWKLGHGHQNLINSFNYPNYTIHKVWPESIIWFKR